MARDSLRSTLDNLEVDGDASSERPYLEAALRRMGYTEAEIQVRMGGTPPTAGMSEYKLVKPIIANSRRQISPFEDLQTAEELTFEEQSTEPQTFEVTFEEVPAAAKSRDSDMVWEDLQQQAAIAPQEADATLQDVSIDTFGNAGGDGGGAPRTRIRVRRVRAGSRQEAEAKVEGKGRHVIKSIPVDIVERWGPGESRQKGAR